MAGAGLLIKPLGLFLNVNTEKQAHQPHGQQNATNPKRISHRVAHAHLVHNAERFAEIAQYLLTSTQRRGVSDGTGEDTKHHR